MATRKGKPKKTSNNTIDAKEPIFGEKVSNIIPGELIVQLQQSAAASITSSIATGPIKSSSFTGALTFGINALDNLLADIKVTSITRLHPPAPVSSVAMEVAVPMASTFHIRYSGKKSPAEAAAQFEKLEGVEYAEPNCYRETCVTPNDPNFASQWGLAKINCPAAWDRVTGSPNIVVAVIDTGVDLDHPELAPLLVQGTDMVNLGTNPTAPNGFHFEGDFNGVDNDPQDEVGHGTHVAGTIACLSNNAVGVAGVTWSCRIMPVRVLARIVNNANSSDVRGTGSSTDIAAGIRWAVDHGARVINMSLGGSTDTQVERDAVAYAIAHNVVVVAALGNGGIGAPTSFPAAYPDVIAVAAIDSSDHRASFSQVGSHIDISGPGVNVLSTVWDNSYTTMSGTSMATPHVAGVAALVLSCNSSLSAAQVGDILRQTARPLRDNPADPVPNNNYGFGCVDAQAAVNRACPPKVSVPILTCPRKSVLIACPSIACPRTTPITCPKPSLLIKCPSVPTFSCPKPSLVISCPSVVCPKTTLVTCPHPSVLTHCPSIPATTCPIPSATIHCPSGLVCGHNPGDPGPIEHGLRQDESGYSGWESYDPYAPYYEDDDGSKGCC